MKALSVKVLPKKKGLFGFSVVSDDFKIYFIYEIYFKKLWRLVLEQLNSLLILVVCPVTLSKAVQFKSKVF